MYATPTFITEALHLLTQVQLLLIDFTCSELMPYNTALAYSYWASFHEAYQCMPRPCSLTILTTVAIIITTVELV